MSDNRKRIRPLDAKRININETHEVNYWTKALGVPKERLIAAVERVGTSANAVKQVLAGRYQI